MRFTNSVALFRLGWLALFCVFLGWYVRLLPAALQFYAANPTNFVIFGNNIEPGLAVLGISLEGYARFHLIRMSLLVLGYLGISGVIFWRRSSQWPGMVFSVLLALFAINFSFGNLNIGEPTGWMAFAANLTFGSIFFCWYFFPDGRFIPAWTVWLIPVWVLVAVLIVFYEGSPADPNTWPAALAAPLWIVLLGSGPASLVYRYSRVSDPPQRQQIKWVVFGIAAYVGVFLAFWIPVQSLALSGVSVVIYDLVGGSLLVMAYLLVPAALLFALLRYHLWDIELIVNRLFLYLLLSGIVILIYFLVINFVSGLLKETTHQVGAAVAAGLVAVLFYPLKTFLQHMINRLFYGARDDPYGIITQLGQRIENLLALDEVFPAISKTLFDSLRVPYAAVGIYPLSYSKTGPAAGETLKIIAENGQPPGEIQYFPLVYRGQPVGAIALGYRSPGEKFTQKDYRVIEGVAFQASAAAHAYRSAAELERAQTHLSLARDEERRLLREELHDSIGPMLAGVVQRLNVAIGLLYQDPTAVEPHLQDLKKQVRLSINDIRRLAHGYSPLILDELGLFSALREFARNASTPDFTVHLSFPEVSGAYPAVVEAALYHIVLEGVNNILQHARASTCWVQLAVGNDPGPHLLLEITDNGIGLPKVYLPGMGIGSMRQRAVELGGTFEILPRKESGTRVRVVLPFHFESLPGIGPKLYFAKISEGNL